MKKPIDISTKTYALGFFIPLFFGLLLFPLSYFIENHSKDPIRQESLGFIFGLVFFLLFSLMAFAIIPLLLKLFFKLALRLQKKTQGMTESQKKWANSLIWLYWILYLMGLSISLYNIVRFLLPPL